MQHEMGPPDTPEQIKQRKADTRDHIIAQTIGWVLAYIDKEVLDGRDAGSITVREVLAAVEHSPLRGNGTDPDG